MTKVTIEASDMVAMLQGIIAAQSAAHLMIVKSLVDAGTLDGPGVLVAMEQMAEAGKGAAADILGFHAAHFRSYLEDTTPPAPISLQVIDGGRKDQ